MEAHQVQSDSPDLSIALFLAAMSRPEPERTQFIHEACSGDAALEAEVLRRVRWEARMNGFLLTPVVPRERLDRPFLPGDAILRGRYRILREAGEGGMGVVFEAFDEKLERRVALKCPRLEFRKRLTIEAAQSLSVHHRNVCRVFEIHTEETALGDVDFLTMEFLDGETLAAALARAPRNWLETGEGGAIARQICDGLEAVHTAGIVHRDLKAGNVMLARSDGGEPRAVIMDFGIAQTADVFTSAMRGTPAYLAPELWKGQPATVRSDIYALGVLLYEMACGRKPFSEDADWHARLTQEPPRPARAGKTVRSALQRCLHPDPHRRFSSVAQLKMALWQPSRRRFYAAGALAASGVLLAVNRRRFWPVSAVRLAILPPNGPASGEARALLMGFLHDLSYRFKTLKGSPHLLSVYAVAQTADAAAATPALSRSTLAATHAIATSLHATPAGWSLSIELIELPGERVLRSWTRRPDAAALAAHLFELQTLVAGETAGQLALRAAPISQPLPAGAYADYLRGIHFARVDYENAARAIPYFERVIAIAPGHALGYAGLAEALLGARYATGDRTLDGKALTALAKAEQLDPGAAHVHLMAGRLNAAAGLYERSLADFRRAAELDPHDAQAFIGMGYSLLYAGRYPEAEAAFHSAFAAQPDYYKPHLEAGILYYELRDFAAAEKHWLEAARLNPAHTRARLNLAVLYLNAGRTAEAEPHIRESLKQRRARPAVELLGDLHEQKGEYSLAIAAYEEAVRTAPPEYKTWASLAAVYRKVGRTANATASYRRGLAEAEAGLASNPRDPDRLAWCAFYHATLGGLDRARARALEAASVADPPAGRVRTRLILTYDTLGDLESALRLIENAPEAFRRDLGRNRFVSPRLRAEPRFLRATGG